MPRRCLKRLILAAGIAGFASGATTAKAAIWEDSLWALSGEADVTVGYDSNLFAIDEGLGDSFATCRPTLLLARKDSMLSLETEVWSDWTTFLKETGNDSVDPGMRMKIGFPANVPDSMPTQTAEIHWIRSTDVNFDVGERVSQDDALLKYEGCLVDTGKLSVSGRASFDRDEYLGATFSTIDTGSLGSTLSYAPQPLFKAGVGYDLTLGRSEANSGDAAALDQTEQAFTFQAEGEFTPKVTGTVSVGAAFSQYEGFFSQSQWEAVASADVIWSPVQRLDVDLRAVRAPSFNADGDVDVGSSLALELRQELSDGFAARIDAQVGRTDHEQIATYRKDSIEGAGAGFDYNLVGRLTFSAGFQWTRQNSDVSRFTFGREVITGKLTYRF
jgi:hypothetical protein